MGLGINANAVEDTVYTALFNPRMDVHSVIHHTDFENLDITVRETSHNHVQANP